MGQVIRFLVLVAILGGTTYACFGNEIKAFVESMLK